MQAKLCVDENILVVPIPGPCALISALSASGLAMDEFTFGNYDQFFWLMISSKMFGYISIF